MKKHIIWTDEARELEAMSAEYGQGVDEATEFLAEELGRWLDDERGNLAIRLPARIVAIADIGRWDGRRMGYKVVGYSIQDCLYSDCDSCTWYVDGYGNMRADMAHHDGCNHVLYRMLRPTLGDGQVDAFLQKLYMGQASDKDVSRYTVRIGDYVGVVYGWSFAGRMPEISA